MLRSRYLARSRVEMVVITLISLLVNSAEEEVAVAACVGVVAGYGTEIMKLVGIH